MGVLRIGGLMATGVSSVEDLVALTTDGAEATLSTTRGMQACTGPPIATAGGPAIVSTAGGKPQY